MSSSTPQNYGTHQSDFLLQQSQILNPHPPNALNSLNHLPPPQSNTSSPRSPSTPAPTSLPVQNANQIQEQFDQMSLSRYGLDEMDLNYDQRVRSHAFSNPPSNIQNFKKTQKPLSSTSSIINTGGKSSFMGTLMQRLTSFVGSNSPKGNPLPYISKNDEFLQSNPLNILEMNQLEELTNKSNSFDSSQGNSTLSDLSLSLTQPLSSKQRSVQGHSRETLEFSQRNPIQNQNQNLDQSSQSNVHEDFKDEIDQSQMQTIHSEMQFDFYNGSINNVHNGNVFNSEQMESNHQQYDQAQIQHFEPT